MEQRISDEFLHLRQEGRRKENLTDLLKSVLNLAPAKEQHQLISGTGMTGFGWFVLLVVSSYCV